MGCKHSKPSVSAEASIHGTPAASNAPSDSSKGLLKQSSSRNNSSSSMKTSASSTSISSIAPLPTDRGPSGDSEDVLTPHGKTKSKHRRGKTITSVTDIEIDDVAAARKSSDTQRVATCSIARTLRMEVQNDTQFPVRIVLVSSTPTSEREILEVVALGGRLNVFEHVGCCVIAFEVTQGWYRSVIKGPFRSDQLFVHIEPAFATRKYLDNEERILAGGEFARTTSTCISVLLADVASKLEADGEPADLKHDRKVNVSKTSSATRSRSMPTEGRCKIGTGAVDVSDINSSSKGNEREAVLMKVAKKPLQRVPSMPGTCDEPSEAASSDSDVSDATDLRGDAPPPSARGPQPNGDELYLEMVQKPIFCVLLYKPQRHEREKQQSRGVGKHTSWFGKPVNRSAACFATRHQGTYSTLVPHLDG